MSINNTKRITHEGVINLGDFNVPCYVLEDKTRILSGRGMQSALKMVDDDKDLNLSSGATLLRYLGQKSLQPFLYKEKEMGHFNPIICYQGEKQINGYEATILIEICNAFLDARKHIKLQSRQAIIADQCESILRALSKLGLIALIDEATGYQFERERNELQKLIDSYVAEELKIWQKTFPDVYYQEIFRLRNWDFTVKGIQKRPPVVGTWTNKIVYEQLPEGVLETLKKNTPKTKNGNYKARFFQSLTVDVGETHLHSQILAVVFNSRKRSASNGLKTGKRVRRNDGL